MIKPKPFKSCRDYERIEKAIQFLTKRQSESPSLAELAAHLQMSPFHLQKLFQKWAGVSPKKFLQYLTLQHSKDVLRKSHNLLSASWEAGLSGPGRLHDLFVTMEAVTPGEFKFQGEGLQIDYGMSETPFGFCFAALTERGILQMSFIKPEEFPAALKQLSADWKHARLVENPGRIKSLFEDIFQKKTKKTFHLKMKGTNFQIKVWEALLKIPSGCVLSYEDVAGFIGKQKAVRAVASAIAKNPVAYLIPCHRVIRKNGEISGYRWKPLRKKAMLSWESSQIFRK